MPVTRDPHLLTYIRDSITRIDNYKAGGRDSFLQEPMIQDAIMRRLEALADAANRLSDQIKARHPEIPWRAIYGFRNVAAHGYLGLNLDRVWETLEANLPALKAAVEEELSRLPSC